MSITRTAVLAAISASLLTVGAAIPATAASNDRVVAFINEFAPLKVWDSPTGCHALPLTTHIIFNETNRPIRIYLDPLCLVPLGPMSRVAPGYSTHVSAVGSFRA